MIQGRTVALILPAHNEAEALPHVLRAVPLEIDRVIVADNGSTDDTALVAAAGGAVVVREPIMGYGRACLKALDFLEASPPHIVAFADADGSDDFSRFPELLEPIADGRAAMSLAARVAVEPGALSPLQRLGNMLATTLIRLIWGRRYQDLGPMRALSWNALQQLNMADPDFGWTVEMQVRAARLGLPVVEVPLPYRRRRAGRSKVSGTFKGAVRAGVKILRVIAREWLPVRFSK